MRTIFIDGYNVINSWAELKEAKAYSYDVARQKLIDILLNYSTYNGNRIILVFDAHMVSGGVQKKEKMGNITIVFTKEGETADSYIERTVSDIGSKKEICVVTSDSLEQQVTFQRGAVRMSSLEFYYEVKKVEQNIRIKTEKTTNKKRNYLEEQVTPEVLEKLEKIRRGR